jgi:hypothetical protein
MHSVQFIFFQQFCFEECNGQFHIYSVVLKFFWLKAEAVVEVGESSARVRPFRTRCQTLSSCHRFRVGFYGASFFLGLLRVELLKA